MNKQKRAQLIEGLYNRNFTYTEIGKRFGISRQRVHQILTGYRSPSSHKVEPINHKILTERKAVLLGIAPIAKDEQEEKHLKWFRKKYGGLGAIREAVRMRDNYTCQNPLCGKVWQEGTRRLDVHHVDEEQEGKNGISYERGVCAWDRQHMDRMITLCHRCHLNLDSVREKMQRIACG